MDIAPVAVTDSVLGPGGINILLVEDEDLVRRLVALILTTHGYSVLEAASGAEALERAETECGRIDLLLTDVVMTGMSGRELAERMIRSRPGLKVLYMSGYTEDAVLRHGVFQNRMAFLSKPFSPLVLVQKIKEVLGTETPGGMDPPQAAASGWPAGTPAP